MPVSSWSTTASDNATADAASGIDWQESMAPSQVNDSARAMMAEIKGFYDNTVLKTGNQTITGTFSAGTSVTATAANGSQSSLQAGQTGIITWGFFNEASTGNLIVGAVGSTGAWKVARNGIEVLNQTWYIGGSARLQLANTSLIPGVDNSLSLGLSGFRWSVVYSATGSINTSDATQKTEVALEEAVLRAVYRVPHRAFKFNDAIDAKGEADARIHYGYFAQDVEAELTAEGIDPATQAFWCEDTMQDGSTRQGLRYEEFLSARMEAERRVRLGTLTV